MDDLQEEGVAMMRAWPIAAAGLRGHEEGVARVCVCVCVCACVCVCVCGVVLFSGTTSDWIVMIPININTQAGRCRAPLLIVSALGPCEGLAGC